MLDRVVPLCVVGHSAEEGIASLDAVPFVDGSHVEDRDRERLVGLRSGIQGIRVAVVVGRDIFDRAAAAEEGEVEQQVCHRFADGSRGYDGAIGKRQAAVGRMLVAREEREEAVTGHEDALVYLGGLGDHEELGVGEENVARCVALMFAVEEQPIAVVQRLLDCLPRFGWRIG